MSKFKKNPSPIMKKQGYGKAKSPFTMKGSPFKQAIGGDAGEAIAHHQKYKKNKARNYFSFSRSIKCNREL